MKVILFDIDTLRADHMGCYGYGRDTTPVMDGIAKEGVCFERYYCPNAPCLPSRASMVTGLYGIHNGIVGHGGGFTPSGRIAELYGSGVGEWAFHAV